MPPELAVEEELDTETPETETEETPTEEATDEEAKPEGEPEAEEGEEEPAAPSRRENRVQKLSNELREERDARIRTETQLEELRRGRSTPHTNPEEARRIENEKLALMDPQERENYRRDKEMESLKQGMAMTQFQMRDAMDKSGFLTEASSNPVAAKYAADVEKLYQEALKAGNFVPRLSLFKYKLGEVAYETAKKPAGKKVVEQKKAAAERVESAKGKPMSGKSDAGSKKGGDDLASLKQRILDREARGEA